MTITDIYTSSAIGATDAVNVSPVKTTLSATTTAVVINAQLTLGKSQPGRSNSPRLYYAVSPFSVTAANARATFRPVAAFLDLVPAPDSSSASTVMQTDPIFNNGGYLYTWIDTPALGVAAALSVKLVEIN